jgi:hypothetical protein
VVSEAPAVVEVDTVVSVADRRVELGQLIAMIFDLGGDAFEEMDDVLGGDLHHTLRKS